MRPVLALLAAMVLGAAPAGSVGGSGGGSGGGSAGGPAAVTYQWPVAAPGRVLTPFRPPAQRYGAGHLGVDLAAGPGSVVRAAAAGTVSFAGSVAGRGVVVVAHADGIRTEYEPLRPSVRVGQRVGSGAVIGRLSGRHAACAAASCVHWGARRGDSYVDPLGLLAPLGPVRLLPWSGLP